MSTDSKPLDRFCLVTVGATVGFKSLTQTALDAAFWHFLRSRNFTHLRIQCGPDIEWATSLLHERQADIPVNLDVDVFGVRNNLMKEEMSLCKSTSGSRLQGLVIAHAGTGTILDAWKLGLPLVVVPNESLLDDHQTEMAKHLATEGYATMSTSELDDLQGAIRKSELLSEENKTRWPPHEVAPKQMPTLRLWEIAPTDVEKEEDAQMVHD
ncbi:hypothetical protein S7711_07365 [Stachybotrys chartarum IBT 7711]|uniref:UDP-N-acetylglucosamine transferase subunit ALG13 n=1 Tax=Stachybotrys chartarum (strain CBS 109288 / IBT 7711) TaxID=1280523 RepID=A0A084AIA0_STACB|nr:hypothetical protein S7711_07365 [Stachybotrys chartarum IBT 7711]KFA74168.1 hypothetical protein S40288_06528 [Stachybotrys chartarum IBT 40288]